MLCINKKKEIVILVYFLSLLKTQKHFVNWDVINNQRFTLLIYIRTLIDKFLNLFSFNSVSILIVDKTSNIIWFITCKPFSIDLTKFNKKIKETYFMKKHKSITDFKKNLIYPFIFKTFAKIKFEQMKKAK